MKCLKIFHLGVSGEQQMAFSSCHYLTTIKIVWQRFWFQFKKKRSVRCKGFSCSLFLFATREIFSMAGMIAEGFSFTTRTSRSSARALTDSKIYFGGVQWAWETTANSSLERTRFDCVASNFNRTVIFDQPLRKSKSKYQKVELNEIENELIIKYERYYRLSLQGQEQVIAGAPMERREVKFCSDEIHISINNRDVLFA